MNTENNAPAEEVKEPVVVTDENGDPVEDVVEDEEDDDTEETEEDYTEVDSPK